MKLDADTAFLRTVRNKTRGFPKKKDERCDNGVLFPAITPLFQIDRSSSVFTIGSCFARNVEDELVAKGISVPTADFSDEITPNGGKGRSNGVLNQYNPATMYQCIEAIGKVPDERALYASDEDEYLDLLLLTGMVPVSHDYAMDRRTRINRLYTDGLEVSSTVIVTLGLVEAWYDRQDDIYLNIAPNQKLIGKHPDRFEFQRFDVARSESFIFPMLERLIDDGRRNIVLTVSPVPLKTTFTGGDCVVSNSYSKAVLRVVAENARMTFEKVDYFPSYEIVSSGGLKAFRPDNRHVKPDVVSDVVDNMVSAYLG